MNVLWLTPEIPYPPYGGRNGVYNRIVQMSKYHTIYLFSIAYSEEEMKMQSKMLQYCKEVKYYNRGKSIVRTLAKSMVIPYSVASRTMGVIKKDINELVGRVHIDVVITEFPNMAMNAKVLAKQGIFITLNEHNIEYKRMRDMASIRTISRIKRLAYYLESIRLEIYEAYLYKRDWLRSITFFSEDDIEVFKNRWTGCKADLKIFPLGANRQTFGPDPQRHQLLFVGRLDNVAVTNIEAVLWFCDCIMPRIHKSVPDAKLIIAGANPSEKVLRLASDSIEVIPNYRELRDVYDQADCVVLPLLSGGGVKGKLIEAISFNKAVVSTSIGVQGTKFQGDKHLLLADNPEGFADACIRALLDPSSLSEMKNAAYRLFIENYEWEGIVRKYSDYLQEFGDAQWAGTE